MNIMDKKEIFRIIDANFNRSREGLRVCEDLARFIWNSRRLTQDLKHVRHGISAVLKNSPATSRILCRFRDTKKDVLKTRRTRSEMQRTAYPDIFNANIERAKESIRVLEEFFKLIDRKSSARFTALRFKVYDIEKRANK